ncbi:hypothetical protein [Candidatus Vidania fulgoroideorum]
MNKVKKIIQDIFFKKIKNINIKNNIIVLRSIIDDWKVDKV